MNLVESMEKIVKISKASVDGKLVARPKFWSGHKVHEEPRKIKKIQKQKKCVFKIPKLGCFRNMHNGPNVCEEKDRKGRINNSFDNKALISMEIFISIELVETFHGSQVFH